MSQSYLSHFGIFTQEGFIRTGEFRGELVDVQHVDGDSHTAAQDWTVWRGKNNRENVRNIQQCYPRVDLSIHENQRVDTKSTLR